MTQEPKEVPSVAKLLIDYKADGSLRVSGIPADKLLGYGMLQVAERVMDGYYAERQSNIVKPSIMPPKFQ
jgi:hypothetical protein